MKDNECAAFKYGYCGCGFSKKKNRFPEITKYIKRIRNQKCPKCNDYTIPIIWNSVNPFECPCGYKVPKVEIIH